MFENFTKRVAKYGVVPVIALEDVAKAPDLAAALINGGLPVAEVTFRTKNAVKSIKAMASMGNIEVGAGTVRSIDQAQAAIDAGASFLVTPGFNTLVVEWAIKKNIPILPGVDSTLGLELALDLGLKTVKFFPAGASGGLNKIQALHGPYADIRFVPTGGISSVNLAEWLIHPAIIACGGSWLVNKEILVAGNWDAVCQLTQEAVKIVSSITS